MAQPPGYEHSQFFDHVCRLHKAIYGLKQVPRPWYSRLYEKLVSFGFLNSKSDSSLFIYNEGGVRLFVLIYVDDIIITGSHASSVESFICTLDDDFSLKDLGELNYFLGVETTKVSDGLFLSQRRYIFNLLERTKMSEAKPVSLPMSTSTSLSKFDSTTFDDPHLYRSTVGTLQYLSLTRPDISFTINKVCQFMHHPSISHWAVAKRILCYLKNTIDHGLLLRCGSTSQLSIYSDAD
ncbi:hypothetical protein F2P56_018659 [Juglans regia]|uniref:Reverse transcriptase Ty1/copia-type domain-containing protein n=1 Tax=Juglans regia TaxID=51240 RepID=A0A833X7B1_JUGRE|nr:hypothetical protein F2P56_018659 [Juglans regia]